jgi:HD-GYP domain-containing protein (c-di-GMP phosphodiesterase class II)
VRINGEEVPMLSESEIENLCIRKGTLTEAERNIIQNHVVSSIKMLSQLPWPKKLRHVCEYAGEHHEKLDGTGYPHKLLAEELSMKSRILALADIFEALTAADRPYKEGKKLSECIKIMGFMVKDKHLDKDVVDFFIKSGMAQQYALKELKKYQIDKFTYEGVEYPVGEDGGCDPQRD